MRQFSEFLNSISSFVVFNDNVYELREGITSRNCISRKIADMLFRFKKLRIKEWAAWSRIRFWRRFFDDILGLWRVTVRQFEKFINELNKLSSMFGTRFGDHQIGTSVNYLDVTLTIDEGFEQYCELPILGDHIWAWLHAGAYGSQKVATRVEGRML